MVNLYRQELLDHYKNPQNFGEMKRADVAQREINPHCGDVVKIYLRFDKQGKVSEWQVREASFQGVGCAVSLASASIVTEAVKGKTVDQIKGYGEEWIQTQLKVELTSSRIKCAMLPVLAIQEAVKSLKTEEKR